MNKTTNHPYLTINLRGGIVCTDDTITKAEIPEYVNGIKVTSIGWDAFGCCESLKEITIPNSVTSIGDLAFFDCSSLTEINIPNSVTSIGSSAFFGCTALSKIVIPNNVTKVGDAFYGCDSLKAIYIDQEKDSLDLSYMDIPKNCKVYWKGEF